MTRRWPARFLGLAAAILLSACTNDPQRQGDFALLLGFGAALVAPLQTGPRTEAAASTPQTVSAFLDRLPAGVPVARVELPQFQQSAFAIESGRNRGTRTFTSFTGQSMTLRSGVLIATRGLSADLMSASTDGAERLIAARRSGSAARVYRFLDGNDDEVDFPATCTTASEGASSVTLVTGARFSTTRMRETCQAGDTTFRNTYWVTGAGRIVKSEQWVSERIGMVRIEHVRD